MAKPILHTKFHQNRTMGLRSAPALYMVGSKGSDPFTSSTTLPYQAVAEIMRRCIFVIERRQQLKVGRKCKVHSRNALVIQWKDIYTHTYTSCIYFGRWMMKMMSYRQSSWTKKLALAFCPKGGRQP